MRFAALILAAFLANDPAGWDQHGPLRFALLSTIGFSAIAVAFGSGDSRSAPLPRWAVIGWVLVVSMMAISTLANALDGDFWHALIGTPDRHFGLATWLLVAGLFAISTFHPESAVEPVVRSVVLAGWLTGIWAALEASEIGWFATSFADDRVGGPFGQPAFLGAGMVLVVPVCLGAAARRTAPTGRGRVH